MPIAAKLMIAVTASWSQCPRVAISAGTTPLTISALTGATLVDLVQYPLTRELCIAMMREAETIANKLGVTFRVGIDRRIAGAEKVGAHRTSMLQDLEAGKPLELDALVGSVVELGRLTDTPTPHIDAVYACTSLLAKTVADQGARSVLAHA